MPKLTCPCGYVHDLSPIPDEGWLTMRDCDYADAYPQPGGTAPDPSDVMSRLMKLCGLLYECPYP